MTTIETAESSILEEEIELHDITAISKLDALRILAEAWKILQNEEGDSQLAYQLLRSVATSEQEILFHPGTQVVLEPNPEAISYPESGLNPVIVLSGITSCGKDYLAEQLNTQEDPHTVVGFGQMLAETIGVHRDELRKLTTEELESHYPAVVQAILDKAPCIVTSHPVFKQGETWCFNPTIYNMLNPTAFVVVTAKSPNIMMWRDQRNKKGERVSPMYDFATLDMEQEIIINTLEAYSRRRGLGLVTVQNDHNNTEQNISFLRALYASLKENESY